MQQDINEVSEKMRREFRQDIDEATEKLRIEVRHDIGVATEKLRVEFRQELQVALERERHITQAMIEASAANILEQIAEVIRDCLQLWGEKSQQAEVRLDNHELRLQRIEGMEPGA